jgi:hypothetical protein
MYKYKYITTTSGTMYDGVYTNVDYPKKRCPHCGEIIDNNKRPYEFEQPCLAEQCAERIRREQGLPPGTPVPVLISCPCPRCSPRY